MARVWDMVTSGDDRGTVVQPPAYVDGDDAIRVRAYLALATKLGTYSLDPEFGLDMDRIMDPATTDAERGAIVEHAVLEVNGVESIIDTTAVVTDGAEVSIAVSFVTITGATVSVGL